MNTLSDPDSLRIFPRGPGLALKTLALIGLCVALIVADSRSERLTGLRELISVLLTPFVWTASLPAKVGGVAEHLRSRESLLRENRRLRERQLVIGSRQQRVEALEAENRRLRGLLGATGRLDTPMKLARVIGISQDPYRDQISLNLGSSDQVYRGQALIDSGGVIGQIIEVHRWSSVAMLITDPNHGLPVEISRTGLQTIAQGLGDGASLRLPYLPGNADVQVGDLLLSSSLGDRFPDGYPVATIAEVRLREGDPFKEAIAYPSAELRRGRDVLLVWNPPPQEPTPAQGPVQGPAEAPINDRPPPENTEPAQNPPGTPR